MKVYELKSFSIKIIFLNQMILNKNIFFINKKQLIIKKKKLVIIRNLIFDLNREQNSNF